MLDKFAKVTGTLISAKGEQKSDATKTANGFTLPFSAAPGDGIVAEDASYPLYIWKQQGKDVTNWFYPAARYITSFAAQQPKLVFDLVPTGQEGQFKLVFKDQPKAKTKVTLVTESGWSKEAHTDEQGLVKFDMPWKGVYVAEVSFNDRNGGERAGANGSREVRCRELLHHRDLRERQRPCTNSCGSAGNSGQMNSLVHRVGRRGRSSRASSPPCSAAMRWPRSAASPCSLCRSVSPRLC